MKRMTNERQSRVARRQATKNKKNNNKSIWKKIGLSILALIALITTGVLIVFGYFIITAPPLDHSLLGDPASTKVYDINGDLFADLGQERRTKISINDLPDELIDAVLATEDARFYEHSGIDIRRSVAAIFANITDGFGAEGGRDRKSTRLNSSHVAISYAVFCLKKKKNTVRRNS